MIFAPRFVPGLFLRGKIEGDNFMNIVADHFAVRIATISAVSFLQSGSDGMMGELISFAVRLTVDVKDREVKGAGPLATGSGLRACQR